MITLYLTDYQGMTIVLLLFLLLFYYYSLVLLFLQVCCCSLCSQQHSCGSAQELEQTMGPVNDKQCQGLSKLLPSTAHEGKRKKKGIDDYLFLLQPRSRDRLTHNSQEWLGNTCLSNSLPSCNPDRQFQFSHCKIKLFLLLQGIYTNIHTCILPHSLSTNTNKPLLVTPRLANQKRIFKIWVWYFF